MGEIKRKIPQSFVDLVNGSLAGRFIGFGINLLLTRLLGAEGFGLFGLGLAAIQTYEVTARVGVDYGLNCKLTDLRVSEQYEEARAVAGRALYVNGVLARVLGTCVWIWIILLGGLLPDLERVERTILGSLIVISMIEEGRASLYWELLLCYGESRKLALKQGLFAPIKLLLALLGGGLGVIGAVSGYTLGSIVQLRWLRYSTSGIRSNISSLRESIVQFKELITSGLVIYVTNSISALVFLPLLVEVARTSGLEDVGYFRVGQLVVQVITLVPGAITPLLFIKLRRESQKNDVDIIEQSLMAVWTVGLISLLGYIAVDRSLISLMFGAGFAGSILATRILVLVAVIEAVGQVLHTPALAKGKVRLFVLGQNIGSVIAGIIGWLMIPSMGLKGLLVSKLISCLVPLVVFGVEIWDRLNNKVFVVAYLLCTLGAGFLCIGTQGIMTRSLIALTILTVITIVGYSEWNRISGDTR